MSSDLKRGRLQGVVITLTVAALIGCGVLVVQWWLNRMPDLGAPVYPRSAVERTIENDEYGITTYYVTAPTNRDELFDFYEKRGADCSEGICFDDLECGTYYAYISGTVQGVTRYALEVRKEGCSP